MLLDYFPHLLLLRSIFKRNELRQHQSPSLVFHKSLRFMCSLFLKIPNVSLSFEFSSRTIGQNVIRFDSLQYVINILVSRLRERVPLSIIFGHMGACKEP